MPRSVLREGADGATMLVDVESLVVGDLVRVPYGEAFAVDGTVMHGWTQTDESLLTGESRPVPKHEGDPVIAGSLTAEGRQTLAGAEELEAMKHPEIDQLLEAVTKVKKHLDMLAVRLSADSCEQK